MRQYLCVVLVLVALAFSSLAAPSFQWHQSGVGAPLRSHSDFERVGGVCPENKFMAGLRFTRGGCQRLASWEQGEIAAKCDASEHSLEQNEGLYLELDCQDAPAALNDYRWVATGVGAPLVDHTSFSRLGAKCPRGYVATGARFVRGGCGIDATWTQEVKTRNVCSTPSDFTEGLMLELKCAKLVNADRATFSWHEAGIGAPLASHADFERVGGHCRPNEVITGVTFKRAGCRVHTSWESNGLSSVSLPPCPANTENIEAHEGLVVALLCGIVEAPPVEEEPVPPQPVEEEEEDATQQPIPKPVPDIMVAHVPFSSGLPFHPLDESLFVAQVSSSLNLPASFVRVISQYEQRNLGKVVVSFELFTPNTVFQSSAGATLIAMVEQHDKALRDTYLGIPGARVAFAQLAAPEPVPQEPMPAEPVPQEPVPAEPVPAEPVPAAPVPTVPVPAVPVPLPAEQSGDEQEEEEDVVDASLEDENNDEKSNSNVLIDLSVYAAPVKPKPSSSSSGMGAGTIVAIVLGCVTAVVMLGGVLLMVLAMRRRRSADTGTEMNQAFVSGQEEEGGLGYIMHQPAQPQVFWTGTQYVSIRQQ